MAEARVGAALRRWDVHHKVCVLDRTTGSARGAAQTLTCGLVRLGPSMLCGPAKNEATSGRVHTVFSLPTWRHLPRKGQLPWSLLHLP